MAHDLKRERQQCWEARDAYFACLDASSVVAAGSEGPKTCVTQKKAYEKNCAHSWVEYFNKRRVLAVQQKDILAEAEKQRVDAESKGFRR